MIKMAEVKNIIGGITFVIGIILCGIFFYSFLWSTLFLYPSYWFYLIIGAPFLTIGTYLLNKK